MPSQPQPTRQGGRILQSRSDWGSAAVEAGGVEDVEGRSRARRDPGFWETGVTDMKLSRVLVILICAAVFGMTPRNALAACAHAVATSTATDQALQKRNAANVRDRQMPGWTMELQRKPACIGDVSHHGGVEPFGNVLKE
jgi:hypothetical protein